MKSYEAITNIKLNNNEPAIARLDGHGFSKFTKGFTKPYDENFGNLMILTSLNLFKQYRANIVYTQSDEITLIFMPTFNDEM